MRSLMLILSVLLALPAPGAIAGETALVWSFDERIEADFGDASGAHLFA